MKAGCDSLAMWRKGIGAKLSDLGGFWGRGGLVSDISLQMDSKLHEACKYVVAGGGKLLRGLLVCGVTYDLTEGDLSCVERATSVATAVELLHAASLIHDDLPALDNDDLRRGRPSCHRAFGEATAILTGDALIGAAFIAVTREITISSDRQAQIVGVLSRAWWDLCLGQQFDLEPVTGRAMVSRETMIRLKTGALFGAAVGCGAICAGVTQSNLESFIQWGVRVGECFQALDDLDDGERTEKDRELIRGECEVVKQESHRLDVRLVNGQVARIIAEILRG